MKRTLLILSIALSLFTCKREDTVPTAKTFGIKGYAQKGPFTVGTDITVAELDEKLFPTGRVFFATVSNNEGYFELSGIDLVSTYVLIKAEGNYVSEVRGVGSDKMTLYAIADLKESSSINVNIFTHLQKERVETLVQKQQMSYSGARQQAFKELLKIFSWDNLIDGTPESLDITTNNNGGAILLAASTIFENSQLEFSDRVRLMTNLQYDLADDGLVSNDVLKNLLFTSAYLIPYDLVSSNMQGVYAGKTLPDIRPMITTFIKNSGYVNYFDAVYPDPGDGSINLLRDTVVNLDNNKRYVLMVNPGGMPRDSQSAEFSEDGAQIEIEKELPAGIKIYPEDSSMFVVTNAYRYQQPPGGTPIKVNINYQGTGTANIFSGWICNGMNFGVANRVHWQK